MKDFRTYVAEAKKVNEYKLRLALNELTDSANVGKIKQYLEQYGLHGFKNPTKTIWRALFLPNALFARSVIKNVIG